MTSYDVIVIGGGAAGLSAALNLVRARRRTLVVDANRPRNAATLHSHGFLTRDGVPPLELRALGRAEVEAYDEGTVAMARADTVAHLPDGTFEVRATGIRGGADVEARAHAVLVATGLTERLPELPSVRAYYGTALHSCLECDGYEKAGERLALIGTSDDLAERALELTQWAGELVVFTMASDAVTAAEERALAPRNVTVERRPVADIEGERGTMTGVRLADGTVVPVTAGFVRPEWTPQVSFLEGLPVERDPRGLIAVDRGGRTSLRGLYAAGDATAPGPQQLIVAAGEGANVATAINRDLIGPLEA